MTAADEEKTISCACGCGQLHSGRDPRGRPKTFAARGHNLRERDNYMNRPGVTSPFAGHRHTLATRKILSEKASVPKPQIRGARNGMSGRTGAASPNYKGGSTPERQRLYASGEWKAIVRRVYERDGYRCRRCGSPKRGPKSLHAHHIKSWADHPELRFDLDNLITLCRPCHHDEHRKGGGANQ